MGVVTAPPSSVRTAPSDGAKGARVASKLATGMGRGGESTTGTPAATSCGATNSACVLRPILQNLNQ